jgi:hypothetical protein
MRLIAHIPKSLGIRPADGNAADELFSTRLDNILFGSLVFGRNTVMWPAENHLHSTSLISSPPSRTGADDMPKKFAIFRENERSMRIINLISFDG